MGNQKGFSLIELMIVVVIIALLAALAIPRFMHATEVVKCQDALIELRAAEQKYFDQHNRYGALNELTLSEKGQLYLKDPELTIELSVENAGAVYKARATHGATTYSLEPTTQPYQIRRVTEP